MNGILKALIVVNEFYAQNMVLNVAHVCRRAYTNIYVFYDSTVCVCVSKLLQNSKTDMHFLCLDIFMV